MAHVIIALGSNSRQSAHIAWASQRLYMLLDGLWLSPALWSPDIRQTGAMYLNRLATGSTMLSADELTCVLKGIETATGRNSQQVTIDLDVMLYDNLRYHERDWSRPYIQRLLPFLRLSPLFPHLLPLASHLSPSLLP